MTDLTAVPGSTRPSGIDPDRRFRREPAWSNAVEKTEPVTDRRLSGEHWWDPDRIAHRDDAPRFCPACGESLADPSSIAVEFWESERRVFHTQCGQCSWTGDIARVERMVGHEPPH